ncbi:MAG: hypothetical protein JWM77_1947, partial [Rhodospirillales bacterium]|nr:hypothetical protein [Rhodospirillales bacterium]
QFRLDYAGGDGNDVTLTALTTNIPAPAPDPSTVWTGPFLRTVADANGSVLSGTFGNDAFVGGAGRDTVVLRVQFADTTIEQRGDGLLAITSALGTDTMRNVEQVAFANGTLRLDLGGTRATAIEALYHAALGRAPDAGGLQVQLDSGIDVRTLAHAFADSPEFQRRWGGTLDVDFVRSLYDNVLNRQPDLGGFLAQLDALAHGTSRADLLANFALSGEAVQVLARQHPTGVFVSDLFAF